MMLTAQSLKRRETPGLPVSLSWRTPVSPGGRLAISLSIEAAEVLEFFQWKDEPPAVDALADELADVMLYLLQLASVSGIDLEQAAMNKLRENYGRSWGEG